MSNAPVAAPVQAVGVTVVVGYGLTETSPVLTVRNLACNVRGTIGERGPGLQLLKSWKLCKSPVQLFCLLASCSSPALICLFLPHCTTTVYRLAAHLMHTPSGPSVPDTEIRIVDLQDHRLELQDGQQGLIMAKGFAPVPGRCQPAVLACSLLRAG